MKKKVQTRALLAGSLVFVLLAAACAPAVLSTATQAGPVTLNVMTHDSFAASQPVIDSFQQQYNVKLNFIKSGDAGQLVNKAILAKNTPLADVLYGVDNTFLSRALEAGIFEPYDSPLLKAIPAEFKLDSNNQALPVDYGDVCINYDKTYFKDKNLRPPATLEDLTKPEYKGLLVTENPTVSSPGLAFMLATVVHFGDPGFLDYWKELKNNGLVVVNDWETAYYTNFSGSSGRGSQPMVVSYNSSPAAEVVFSKTPLTESPDASITGPGTCFRQVEFVGILKGSKQLDLAQKFIDFMLAVKFQEDMPLQMFVYPTNPDAKLPDAFVQYSPLPSQPAEMPPATIAANRDQWIQEWQNTVLK